MTAGEQSEESRLGRGSVLIFLCRSRRKTCISGNDDVAVIIVPYTVTTAQRSRLGL